jgi:sulfur carrier protein
MKILVNGALREIGVPTLEAALDELGYRDRAIATALNGEFIPATVRANAVLYEGDRVEVLAPMQGG